MPAYVLCTTDGGKMWAQVYQNTHEKAFLDDLNAIRFAKGTNVGWAVGKDGQIFKIAY